MEYCDHPYEALYRIVFILVRNPHAYNLGNLPKKWNRAIEYLKIFFFFLNRVLLLHIGPMVNDKLTKSSVVCNVIHNVVANNRLQLLLKSFSNFVKGCVTFLDILCSHIFITFLNLSSKPTPNYAWPDLKSPSLAFTPSLTRKLNFAPPPPSSISSCRSLF